MLEPWGYIALIFIAAPMLGYLAYYIYTWATDYELAISKINRTDEVSNDILNSKLCDLFIKTSHNSYIRGTQNFSTTDMKIFEQVLRRGYKGIELDIAEYENEIYVVHRGDVGKVTVYTTNKMPVEPYFEMISKYMNEKETMLLLFLEVYISSDALRTKLCELILKHLKMRLLVNTSFATRTLKELMGKICIVTTVPNVRLLERCVTAHLYTTNQVISKDSNYKEPNMPNVLSRIYPSESLSHALSNNYDANTFFKQGHNCISMNVNKSDKNMYEYEKFFNGCSFKKIERR